MPNLVPYDKFQPRNLEKAWEYLNHIARISPERLKYGDEKSLKGKAIFNKKARRDVLTGLVPHTMTDPDLRNRYSIIGICGICNRSLPVWYQITDATVDADLFTLEIESAIASRYLQVGDVLVLDNAANHMGKGNTVLEDWLWEEHMGYLLGSCCGSRLGSYRRGFCCGSRLASSLLCTFLVAASNNLDPRLSA